MLAIDPIAVRPEERTLLEKWVRAGTTPQRLATRARIILLAADGYSSRTIARRLSVSVHTATLWRRRFQEGRVPSLQQDAPGRGRRTTVRADAIARIDELLAADPASGPEWTVRGLAKATGISRSTIHRARRQRADR
jgi:transposase